MTIDLNAETSLAIAEKLLEQERIINTKRIEVLCQIVLKFAKHSPELKNIIEEELTILKRLEKNMEDLEIASRGFLSTSDQSNIEPIVFE